MFLDFLKDKPKWRQDKFPNMHRASGLKGNYLKALWWQVLTLSLNGNKRGMNEQYLNISELSLKHSNGLSLTAFDVAVVSTLTSLVLPYSGVHWKRSQFCISIVRKIYIFKEINCVFSTWCRRKCCALTHPVQHEKKSHILSLWPVWGRRMLLCLR